MPERILIVDDEPDLLELVRFNLSQAGFEVETAQGGLEGLEKAHRRRPDLVVLDLMLPDLPGTEALDVAQRETPDLVVLDLMLPGIDGTEVARRMKADSRTAGIPIVMLTAKGEETDIVVGLTLGADDYVTKPFSMKVLLARIATVLRRGEQAEAGPAAEGGVLRAGPLVIDTSKHEVTVDGDAVRLTLTEFKLLSALVSARGRVLTRDQLMDKAMGTDVFVTDRAIDVHITAIRKKLGTANWLVHTVRGVGYRLQESPGEGE